MIINNHAQVSRHGLRMERQEWAWRKVDHPEVVDAGRFKGLGGPRNILAQQITAPVSIQIVLLQPAIHRRQSWQSGIGLLPLPVKQFDRNSRETANLFQDPLLL